MARYTLAVCRLCRREGMKLVLKGDRCFSAKCGVERRSYPPGQHGQGRARFSIAHFSEKQRSPFRKSFAPSRRQRRHAEPRYLAIESSPTRPAAASAAGSRCAGWA